MYTYTWYQWLAFFYFYCFFGWIFESAYVSLRERRFVNRGFLRIPLLPLYGFGAVMILWVSLPFKDNLICVYFSGVVAATALEYVTGSVMEVLFKVRYWDYSANRFQVNGYICLSSSIAWGFLTILMTEVIHEPVASLVLSLQKNWLLGCVCAVSAVFLADVYESTRAALALGKSLEALTALKADMEELEARILARKEEAAEQISIARWEAVKRFNCAKAETAERFSVLKEEAVEKKELLTEELEYLKEKKSALQIHKKIHRFYCKGLLHGNPGAVSKKFAAALKELREQLEESDHNAT